MSHGSGPGTLPASALRQYLAQRQEAGAYYQQPQHQEQQQQQQQPQQSKDNGMANEAGERVTGGLPGEVEAGQVHVGGSQDDNGAAGKWVTGSEPITLEEATQGHRVGHQGEEAQQQQQQQYVSNQHSSSRSSKA
ncbi:hypothetical protein CLOP_g22328 [Closterium sp. NIES-67]|nr:hypothetical protein CLOP_g22328 [Closterium sp. NIES-67]